ncbi:hypothetical protein [Photorhabdus temperata]|uniref:hypothetical protein n=1 Tax=Photorhabdus temperata TaxID=574560 RepID=UPI0003FAA038|nr:hypothetical protein [Photorhabdus temperata]
MTLTEKNIHGNQYIPERFISGHTDKNKSNKKLAVTHADIKKYSDTSIHCKSGGNIRKPKNITNIE